MASTQLFTPTLVLFDLDGTLIDSVPDLAYCVDAMQTALNLEPRGEAAVRQWVGNGVQRLVERALCNAIDGTPDADLFAQAMPIFMQLYAEHNAKSSQVYPGVIEALDYLKTQPVHLACVTNKAEQFTLPLLTSLGLIDYFEIVISGDSLAEKKPHPLPLQHVAAHFNLKPSDCLMIGDSRSDVQAARAAGFGIICTSYGYNHGEPIENYQPDLVLDNLAQLKHYIHASAE